MMLTRYLNFIFVLCFLLNVQAEDQNSYISHNEPISALPKDISYDPAKAELGRKLFNDPKLSATNSISCSSCHNLHINGADTKSRSVGVTGLPGDMNTPTVFNSSFNFRQFWDGRAENLKDQMDGPIQHPKEMGSTWDEIVKKLKSDTAYPKEFAKVYKDGINKENIKDAISSFEETLITPNSKFDRYLSGEKDVLSDIEKMGYQKFKSYGCIACHQGINIGGNMYQTMGVMGDYFKDRGTAITDADLGRYTVTKNERDKFVFKVPSLRNVELTPPYFHDGSVKTLEEAVNMMAKYQLGRRLSEEDLHSIVEFLKTLTGEKPSSLRSISSQDKK